MDANVLNANVFELIQMQMFFELIQMQMFF